MTDLHLEGDLRCSIQTSALGELPAGSAGFARRVLLVELPLPWPNKIDRHELLQGLDLGSDKSIKLLGIYTNEQPVDEHRVICWERTEPFCGYERTETTIETSELVATIGALARSGPTAIDDPSIVDPATRDLLICTHGTRDRCCGQYGTRLFAQLEDKMDPVVRVWRASHTGGHRFAPTGILFPHGTTWATLDAELAMGIVEQTVPTNELASHHRGNLGIAGRAEQVAESATFLGRGWGWLDSVRSVEIVTRPDADGSDESETDTVVAVVRSADHTATVTMEARPAVPVPACGQELEAATKATPQFHVITSM